MNAGPYGTPPGDAPEPEPTPAETPPAETPASEAPASSYVPPPSAQPAAPPRRGAGPLVAIAAIVVILIVIVLAYGVGGYAYAQGKINSAQSSYNAVVDHQNSLNDTVNSLNGKITGADVSTASAASIAQDKAAIQGIVSKSQAAQSQIDSDDQSLQNADSSLQQNSWLTVLRKPDIDKMHTRIQHLRTALADAKTITADYVKIGTFYQALFDVVSDLNDVGTKAEAKDLAGANAATAKLKTDTDKAISLDKAPGLPADVDTLLQAIKSLATDFAALFTAVANNDSSAANAANTALQADVAKIQAVNYTKIGTDIDNFYKPLIDAYNSEIDKANST